MFKTVQINKNDTMIKNIWSSGQIKSNSLAYFNKLIPPDGYVNVGNLITVDEDKQTTNKTINVLFAKNDPEVVAYPIGAIKLWDNYGGGGKTVSIWELTPPQGFKCLGDVINDTYDKPDLTQFYCVNEKFLVPYQYTHQPLWNDYGSFAEKHVSVWKNNGYHTFYANK